MKIESIRASQPATPGAPKDWRTSLGQILVTIETEDGLTGYGVGGGGQAAVHVIETVIGPALTGQDATDVEELWEAMYSMTLAYGRKGLAIMAISGVDLAVWDLRAKRANLPLAYILADDVRATVPAYRTGRSPDAWINEGTEGFTALKLSLSMSASESVGDVVERVRRVREALGPDVQLMGDAFMSLDVETTLRIADGLADVDLGWFEEPLPADDLTGYARLRDECAIPVAGGEHEYTATALKMHQHTDNNAFSRICRFQLLVSLRAEKRDLEGLSGASRNVVGATSRFSMRAKTCALKRWRLSGAVERIWRPPRQGWKPEGPRPVLRGSVRKHDSPTPEGGVAHSQETPLAKPARP